MNNKRVEEDTLEAVLTYLLQLVIVGRIQCEEDYFMLRQEYVTLVKQQRGKSSNV